MLLLALALPAHAVDYKLQDHLPKMPMGADSLYRNPGVVSLEGTAELPLYDDGSPDTRGPQVEMVLADGTKQLVGLGLGSSAITLTEGTVKALGGETKERKLGKEGTVEVATVSFELGDASFEGVSVRVGSQDQLGLLAFQNLSVGIFPSEGVVRLADAGALSMEGGTRIDYTRIESASQKDGARKWQQPAYSTLVTGTWNDQPATIRLMFQNEDNQVVADLTDGLEPVYSRGGIDTHTGVIELTGLEPFSASFDTTNSTAYTFSPYEVTVGPAVTSAWDVVFDGQGTLSIKPTGAVNRVSWDDTRLEQALEGLEKPEDAEDDWTVPASAHLAVAAAYNAMNRHDDALVSAEKAFELTEEKDCTTYTDLAGFQLMVQDHEGARDNLAKGVELYDTWGDLDANDRVAILEKKAKVEDGVKLLPGEWARKVVQSHACDASRSDLVWVESVLGNWDEVDRIWTEDRDVDKSLGESVVTAYLAQERWDEAFAALSWTVSNGGTDYWDSNVALTYALIQDQQGKTDQAWSNYERALGTADDTELLTIRAYAAAHAARNGREATVKHLAEVSAASTSPHAKLVYAESLQGAGQDATAALAAAADAYNAALVTDPGQASWHAGLSGALLRSGDLEGAKTSAESALKADMFDPLSHLALGDVLVMTGDDAASEHYRTAAIYGADNPLLATML
ncbi:MAG: hypothetical protein GY884_28920 [Proteobacteria bacterium]|nr:hypothetical protein [Pseudomonadota bacterium]